MRPVVRALVELLRLERETPHGFVGQSQDLGWGAIFGGQALGQALSAAAQTVPEDRVAHSLHAYFLRQGDASRPVRYEVDAIRDGRSFNTRRVVATQGDRAIFSLAASFHIIEPGFEHADTMPDVPGPDGLESEVERATRIADRIPERLRARATREGPIEMRLVDPGNPLQPAVRPAHRCVWYRMVGPLPDAPSLHQQLLAYTSDLHFLSTSMKPHGVSWIMPGIQAASLDHAMWFHRSFRMDAWLLHVIESPSASGARALVRGRFFTQDGVLVASTVQEGLVRDLRSGSPS